MRSRRGISKRPSILIDTSFLLPALGVEIEGDTEVIKLFRRLEVYYLEIGLLEAMWKILRIVSREKLERVRIGLEAIRKSYRVIEPPPEAYIKAIEIYDKGHRDYIDALHYTTARALGLLFLTIDFKFIEFLKNNSYPVEGVVITPKELRDRNLY
ncbi:MAG: PIN domain-containing protein [Sulfolobales archaeon]